MMSRYKLILFLVYWCIAQCSSSLNLIPQSEANGFNELDIEMVKELLTFSDPKKNPIFIISRVNVPLACSGYGCEIYDLESLENHLIRRGQLHDPDFADPDEPYPSLEEIRVKNAGSRENDVFILKLTNFSPKEIKALNVIKEYNQKSYMIIFVEEKELFNKLKNQISSIHNHIFNIYLMKRVVDSEVYLVYEMCAFCNSGQHALKFSNRWEEGKGFGKKFQFFPSFKGQFQGADVKVGLRIAPPHTFPIANEDGSPIYGGQDYWLMEYIAKSANFTAIIVEPTDGNLCTKVKIDEIGGACRMLRNKEVDLAGFPDSLTYWTHHFFEPIGIVHIVYNRLISARPQTKSKATIKLNSSILIAVAVAYISCVCISVLIAMFQRNRNRNGYVWIAFEVFAILCLETLRFRQWNGLQKMMMGIWLVCTFLIISNVFGELTSTSVADNSVDDYIDSIDDMKERNISWIWPYGWPHPLVNALPEQKPYAKRIDAIRGLEQILQHPKEYVVYAPKEAVDSLIRSLFWNGVGQNPFYFSPPVIGDVPILVSSYLRKGSPYAKAIHGKVLAMEAAGLLRGKYIPDTTRILAHGRQVNDTYEEVTNGIMLDLQSLSVYLWACVAMMTLSFVVFLMELVTPAFLRLLATVLQLIEALNEERRRIFWR